MTSKRVKQKEVTEDFLGLIAFGSLIANIVQIVCGKTLEDKHGALKKYVLELERRYIQAINRNKQISNEYLSLKKINEGLATQVQGLAQQVRTLDNIARTLRTENTDLKKEMDNLREENLKLKASKPEDAVRRKRSIVKRGINA